VLGEKLWWALATASPAARKYPIKVRLQGRTPRGRRNGNCRNAESGNDLFSSAATVARNGIKCNSHIEYLSGKYVARAKSVTTNGALRLRVTMQASKLLDGTQRRSSSTNGNMLLPC
jgi:hypothetical protein